MDGFEFLEALKAPSLGLLSKLKIVVVTSSTNPQDLDKAQQYNIDGYLIKPLSADKLRLQQILHTSNHSSSLSPKPWRLLLWQIFIGRSKVLGNFFFCKDLQL